MKISLPKPNLDDRTFNQLVEEAKKLIPRYAPQWTDHNWSDPGITFIDLFAWLTEMALYRINFVTDSHRLKYLQLLGIRPEPPRPAKVDLTFESKNDFKPKKDHLKAGAGESISVEIDASGKSIDFELDEDITIVPVTLEKVIVDAQTAGVFDRTDANKKADLFYAPFGLKVQKDCALYLGFDKSTDIKTGNYPSDILSFMCYLYEKDFNNEPGEHGDESDCKFKNAKLKWEIIPNGEKRDITLKDETEGFKKSGRIIFKGLKDWKKSKISKDNSNRDLFWLRCTVEESNFEYPPRIETIRLNTASTTQGKTIKDDNKEERRSNGLPYQVFKLNNTPILDKTVELESDEYLFSFDRIINKDKDIFIQYLKNRFSTNWVEDAKIEQINKYNIKLHSNDNCILFKYNPEEAYLFSWDEIPRNDEEKFRDFLKQNYLIDWVNTAKIEKIDDGKTIKISSVEGYLTLRINDERSRVSLKTDYGRTDEFIVRKSNGELNIYEKTHVSLIINDGRTYEFLGKKENNEIKVYDGIWKQVDDFDSSGPQDNHFILDREKGEIKFGDGLNGRVPSVDSNIKIISYRVGGGEEGNIKAGYDWQIEGHYGLEISNHKASTGGKGAESIEEAAGRFISDLKVPYTAVTSQDFEYIARNTPGLRVAEAKAITNPLLFSWNRIPGKDTGRLKEFLSQNFEINWARTAEVKKTADNNIINVSSQPNSLSLRLNEKMTRVILKIDYGRIEEFPIREENDELNIYDNNAVHVAVIPYTPLVNFENPPEPSKGFINAICKHLNEHRLLGTKIRVIPPVYIRVNVNATIVPLKGSNKEKLKPDIEKKVREFLHPITGGDNEKGWKMGKIVSRSDIYNIIEKVEGVDCIVDLTLSGDKISSPDEDGNLELNSGIATIYSGNITITII